MIISQDTAAYFIAVKFFYLYDEFKKDRGALILKQKLYTYVQIVGMKVQNGLVNVITVILGIVLRKRLLQVKKVQIIL